MGLDMDRYQGCLQGLAVGDALGTTVEFKAPGTFVPMEDIMGAACLNCCPDNGQTILRWRSAWRKVCWRSRALTLLTRCSVIQSGSARVI